MVCAILEGALRKLTCLRETQFLDLHGDMSNIEGMLTAIMATLQDAENKQFSARAIKVWVEKLREAAYELDDILDECAYEELRLEYGVNSCVSEMVLSSSLRSFHPMHPFFRSKIAERIKVLSMRLNDIVQEKDQLGLMWMVEERTSRSVPEWHQTISFIDEPRVYGREEDTKKILDFLFTDAFHSDNLPVFPIVGMGGIGKTTLAQLIFNHEEVINHFDLRIWVLVGDDFDFKRTAKAIIEEVSGHAYEGSALDQLQRTLLDLLAEKRYLLVLDDVWSEDLEKWQRLESVLACGANGTSILVTTRSFHIAENMGTVPPHMLTELSDNDCWKLFKDYAFERNEVEPVEFVAIGKEIVKNCQGVPLAIKSLGGLLLFERRVEAWSYILESSMLRSLRSGDSLWRVFELSYLSLPINLRQCFAFCAIFPLDERIEKHYLIDLWIANGFISSVGMLDVQDVGDRVWNRLHLGSFFQEFETDEFGNVKSFKIHDLILLLAQCVANDVYCITDDIDVSTFSKRFFHVSDHRRELEEADFLLLHHVKSLRTAILPHQPFANVLNCYSLRVLHWVQIRELPSSIGDLKHLRYLNLSEGDFKTLPESLCLLWNLQILKLDYCRNLEKLPNKLICLKALQQLSLKHCESLSSLPPHIGKLTFLKILSKYFVGNEKGFLLAELGGLKLKGDLHIKQLRKVKSIKDAEEANMSSKQLNNLILSWDINEELELEQNDEKILEVLEPDTQQLQTLILEGYKGSHFPQWIGSPYLKYLTYLELKSCLHLPALGKLPSLKKLRMYEVINVKYIYEECYDGGPVFMALEYLSLEKLPNLLRLSKKNGKNMFPHLVVLEIDECPKFLAEEVLLQGLHSLKVLHIKRHRKFNMLTDIQCLTRLEVLRIDRCFQLEGLHEALQHMSALQKLTLRDLQNLESLPDCFANLSLLCELSIEMCPKLMCLPTTLCLASSLEILKIYGCRKLVKRCEEDTGDDWPKIAHIPNITLE